VRQGQARLRGHFGRRGFRKADASASAIRPSRHLARQFGIPVLQLRLVQTLCRSRSRFFAPTSAVWHPARFRLGIVPTAPTLTPLLQITGGANAAAKSRIRQYSHRDSHRGPPSLNLRHPSTPMKIERREGPLSAGSPEVDKDDHTASPHTHTTPR